MSEHQADDMGGLFRTGPAPAPRRPVPSGTPPAQLGFRMPGEFEPHARTWLAWPGESGRKWANADELTANVAAVARAIRRFEPVAVAVDPQYAGEATRVLGPGFDFLQVPVDDIWMRDTGPSFLVDGHGHLAASKWNFNVWGERFTGYDRDRDLAERVASSQSAPSYASTIITEGGALHVDGEGTVVVTESALLNANRNLGMTREEVERGLNDWLGTTTVIWIPGDAGDSQVDGHIDGLMTFIKPGVALFEVSEDPAHPRFAALREKLHALELAKDARGKRIEIARLARPRELPSAAKYFCGIYVNSLIVNGGVIIPKFGDSRSDAAAEAVFKAAFSDRKVVSVAIDTIGTGGGGIHCITQQQPAIRR